MVPGRPDDYDQHPTGAELVVEVAVSSIAIDHRKLAIYAEAGVREYWIILPEESRAEIYREPIGRDYAHRETLSAPEDILAPVALPDFRLSLSELFSRNPV